MIATLKNIFIGFLVMLVVLAIVKLVVAFSIIAISVGALLLFFLLGSVISSIYDYFKGRK